MHNLLPQRHFRGILALFTITALCTSLIFPSGISFLPNAMAAADDYTVEGGDPGSLPAAGDASIPLGIITLTDLDGDDFSSQDFNELLSVDINTADYPNVTFDNTVGPGGLTIGGTCGHTSAMSLSYPDADTAEIIVTGAGGFDLCNPGETITIEGLKIQTTAKTAAPGAPAHLISVDNVVTSSGSPVASSTLVAYSIAAPDAQGTITLENTVPGDVGNATLSLTLPQALVQNDTIVITFPNHIMPFGVTMATTGTLGGASSFNCTAFAQDVTCTADGPTNLTGTLIMTGLVATGAGTDDASVRVANGGDLNNLIAEDALVPMTDTVALSDNIVTNIAVQDANMNGKLDRFVVTVVNPNGVTAAAHTTAGWNATYSSNAVDLASVTINGAADANPLIIHVNLDENDADLPAMSTSTDAIELTYAQQGVDVGFEFDDFSDIQLVTIAAGDLDATNTEVDDAGPVLKQWSFDTPLSRMILSWSEPLLLGSVVATVLTVQNAATATASRTLTGGTVGQTASDLTFTLINGDMTAISGTAGLLKDLGTAYLRLTGLFATDAAGNTNVPITDGQALQATTFVAPTPAPVVVPTGGGGGGGGGFGSSATTTPTPPKLTGSISLNKYTPSSSATATLSLLSPVSLTATSTVTVQLPGYTLTRGAVAITAETGTTGTLVGTVVAGAEDTIVITGAVIAAGSTAQFSFPVSNPSAGTVSALLSTSANPTRVSIGTLTIVEPKVTQVSPITNASLTPSSTFPGATSVALTASFRTETAFPANSQIDIYLPGFSFPATPVATFTAPSAKPNSASFAAGHLKVKIAEALPAGTITFSVTGATNPSATAASSSTHIKILTEADMLVAQALNMTIPAIVLRSNTGNNNTNTYTPMSCDPGFTGMNCEMEIDTELLGSLELTSYSPGASSVNMDLNFRTRTLMPAGSQTVLTLPGFSFTSPPVVNVYAPYLPVGNRASFDAGKLTITNMQSLPVGNVRMQISTAINPAAGSYPVTLRTLNTKGKNIDYNSAFTTLLIAGPPAPVKDLIITTPLTTSVKAADEVKVKTESTSSGSGVTLPITGEGGSLLITGSGGTLEFSPGTTVTSSEDWDGTLSGPQKQGTDSLTLPLKTASGTIIDPDTVNTVVQAGSKKKSLSFRKKIRMATTLDTLKIRNRYKSIFDDARAFKGRKSIKMQFSISRFEPETSTLQQVSATSINLVPCEGIACNTVQDKLLVTVPSTASESSCTQQSSSVSTAGISIIENNGSSTSGTFLFGQKMLATDSGDTQTVSRPGFGVSATDSSLPTRILPPLPQIRLKTNLCQLSTYVVTVDSVSLISTEEAYAASQSFPDVTEKQPYAQSITHMQNSGVMTGYADGTFQSNAHINRAEFLKSLIMAEYGELDASHAQACFSDVAKDAWYAPYVCFAKQKGIVSGYEDGSFGPGNTINLAEAAKIIVETMGVTKAGSVGPEWFAVYIAALGQAKAIPSTFVYPAQPVDRGALAEIVWRLQSEVQNLPAASL